jgi:hypothetical protein
MAFSRRPYISWPEAMGKHIQLINFFWTTAKKREHSTAHQTTTKNGPNFSNLIYINSKLNFLPLIFSVH